MYFLNFILVTALWRSPHRYIAVVFVRKLRLRRVKWLAYSCTVLSSGAETRASDVGTGTLRVDAGSRCRRRSPRHMVTFFLLASGFRWRAAFLLSLRIPVELLEFYEAFENASQRPFADNFLSFIQPSHLVSKDLQWTGVRRGAREGGSRAAQDLLQGPEWRCQVLWKGSSQPQACGDTLVPPGMLTPFFNSPRRQVVGGLRRTCSWRP